jgi:cytochrome c-type biogenesis protein CcsB
MTNQTLALYANYALYSAMAVFTIAMIAFAIDLAGARPEGAASVAARTSELVGAGGSVAARAEPASPPLDRPGPVSSRTTGPPALPRRRKAAGIAMSLSWLGLMLLVLGDVLRGWSVHRAPLGNMFEFACVGTTFVMAVFLGLSLRRDVRWLGLFVVGPVLLTLGLALTVFYTQASQLLPSLRNYWLLIHVTVATLSVALFTIGFSVTILHLLKASRESSPPAKPGFMESLPSAAALDRTAYGLHVVAFPLWTFTLIAGAIWAEQAWGHYWNWDPKEVWTFVIWVVYAAYLHARATTGWSVRSASYLALAGYACILVNYMVVNVYFVGQHSYSGIM